MFTHKIVRTRAMSGEGVTRRLMPERASVVVRPLVSSMVLEGLIRAKLTVGSTGDLLEREADRAADQVMRTPDPHPALTPAAPRLRRKCASCEEEEEREKSLLRAKRPDAPGLGAEREAPEIVGEALRTPGLLLDRHMRDFFEPRFGHDFSRVRLHTGPRASQSATALGARAYTVGNDVVFGEGEWSPQTESGRRLLAHELVHVAQQEDGVIRLQAAAPLTDPDAVAAEVHTLLNTPDPVAGMRTAEAIQRLQGLDATQVLAVLRALRGRYPTDLPILQQVEAPLLVSVVAETVSLEVATSSEPELLARYRGRVQRLPAPDRTVVIRAFPTAAVPADPVLPTGGLVPPPGAPAGIPAPLLETLYRSYARRQAGIPGSEEYLANAFWSGRPVDFWQALKQMGAALSVIQSVYARWTASSVPWSFVDAFYQAWTGTSDGFNFYCRDRSGLEAALNNARSFCKDHVGGAYHFVEGTTPCWREIISGSPGLHVCTGGSRTTVHIDPHQVVSGTWPFGYCSYDMTGSVIDHFRDLGWW
jgi:hypothetical protein